MHKAQLIEDIDSAEKAVNDAFQAAAQDIANAQAAGQAGPQPGAQAGPQHPNEPEVTDVDFEEVK